MIHLSILKISPSVSLLVSEGVIFHQGDPTGGIQLESDRQREKRERERACASAHAFVRARVHVSMCLRVFLCGSVSQVEKVIYHHAHRELSLPPVKVCSLPGVRCHCLRDWPSTSCSSRSTGAWERRGLAGEREKDLGPQPLTHCVVFQPYLSIIQTLQHLSIRNDNEPLHAADLCLTLSLFHKQTHAL